MSASTKPTLTLDQYLELVLPPGGNYFVEYRTLGGNHTPKLCATLADASLEIRKRAAARLETWIGIGTFGSNRRGESVREKKAFYVDLDCGPGKPYPNKKSAMQEVRKVIKKGTIPAPTIIIDSGNGIHLYWVLEDPIAPEDWKQVAFRFRASMNNASLHVDDKVTTDIARILRPPETWNVKDSNNHRPCRVLGYFPQNTYTTDKLYLMLPVAEVDSSVSKSSVQPSALSVQLAALGQVDDLINGANLSPFANLTDCERIRVTQDMLRHLSKPKYYDDYDEWLKIGKALQDASSMCDAADSDAEWMDIWDQWSQQSQKYDPAAINNKWKGQFPKFNDVHFGSLVFRAKNEGFVFPNAIKQVDYPPGYIATDFGTVRQAGDDEKSNTLVFEAHLFDPETWYDQDRGSVYRARVVLPKSRCETELETTTVHMNVNGAHGFPNDLGRAGIRTRNPKQVAEAAEFVQAFMSQIARQRGVNKAINTYGWAEQDGRTAFCAGPNIHWSDGETTPAHVRDGEFKTLYRPNGSYHEWQKMLQMMLDQGRPEIDFVLASSFAAPLVKFTAVLGIVLSIVSRDSGTGKTTALRGAQSVWGRPQGSINALDDTVNAVTRRLEVLQNLPAYWDELRMREQVRDFMKLVFQLSQGKGKSRMNSAAILQHTGTWATLIGVAGNEPLHDLINKASGATNAGALRLIEIEINPLPKTDVARHLRMFNGLDIHYGHAGSKYGAWLGTHRKQAEELTLKVLEQFNKEVNGNNEERFWIAGMSAIIGGAMIASQLKILDFDYKKLYRYCVKTFLEHRTKVAPRSSQNDARTLLSGFLADTQANSIKTDQVNMNPGRPTTLTLKHPLLVQQIRSPLSYQMGETDGMLVISTREFAKYLDQKCGVSMSVVLPVLEKLGMQQTRLTMGAGSPAKSPGRIEVLTCCSSDAAFADFFE